MPGRSQADTWRVLTTETRPVGPRVPLEFQVIYERWFNEVSRWIRAMGGPAADRDDLAQDVFLVVHRRLPDFDGQSVAGWLNPNTRPRARDFRRSQWVRHLRVGLPLSETLTKANREKKRICS